MNIVLVGLGPHAKRIYIHFLRRLGIVPALIIDLDSNKSDVEDYLQAQAINTDIFYVPHEERNRSRLSRSTKARLTRLLKELNITHAIVSTEPKAHVAYASLFAEMDLPVLMDKPISSPLKAGTSVKGAKQVYKDFETLYRASLNGKQAPFFVQCQRRYHTVYRYIIEEITKVSSAYHVPITHMDVFHSDGQWVMPQEMADRENHPFKYGYGKMLHSGYHFIDLVAWFVKSSYEAADKAVDSISVQAAPLRPLDFSTQISPKSYDKLFGDTNTISPYITKNRKVLRKLGEIDTTAMVQFSQDKQILTTASISLLHSGFSRRSWEQAAEDLYKGNGRVRRERINIEVGPLMNIQIHSYQAFEVNKEGAAIDPYGVGGVHHLEVYIFRNSDIIGGEPVQVIQGKDLLPVQQDADLGHNELARKLCLEDFLDNKPGNSMLANHALTNAILSAILQSAAEYKPGKVANVKRKVSQI